MGDQSPGHLHRHQDLRSDNHHGGWFLVALHGPYGELPVSYGWHQHPTRLHRSGNLFRTILLFGLELPQLRNGGTPRSLQVIFINVLIKHDLFTVPIAILSIYNKKRDQYRLDHIEYLLIL